MKALQSELDKKTAELKQTTQKHNDLIKDFRPELFNELKGQVETLTKELESVKHVEKNATFT